MSVGLVLACIPLALTMCICSRPLRQSKVDQKIDAQRSVLANFKSYLGNSLNYFTTILELASPSLTASQNQRKKRRRKRQCQQRLFVTAILFAPFVNAESAQTFKKDNYLATYAKFLEEHPPWDHVPQDRKTWSDKTSLLGPSQSKYFDPDNVIPFAEWVNPSRKQWNAANGLLPAVPALPDLQISSPYMDEESNEFMLLLFAATTLHKQDSSPPATFDTDSDMVGIDNRCSVCMSPNKEDFVGELRETQRYIKGFGGVKVCTIWIGTLQWAIEDDDGDTSLITIPGSYYVPEAPGRLLSPQHWSQAAYAYDENGDPDATYCATYYNRAVMYWGEGSNAKTVPIDKQNVFTFALASGYSKFSAFCMEVSYDYADDDFSPDTTDQDLDDESVVTVVYDITTLDEDGQLPNEIQPDQLPEGGEASNPSEGDHDPSEGDSPPSEGVVTFDLDATDGVTVDKTHYSLDKQREDPSAELLRFHYKFGHVGFKRLQAMAKKGIIPSRLGSCQKPVCVACLYGKAHKRPKRKKAPKPANVRPVSAPGDCVSVDILVSATPGLIAQMRGFLTRQRYRYACVFVDHFSDFSYVHLMKKQDGDETEAAKAAFESYAASNGINIKHYHSDNGIFAAAQWKSHCDENQQTTSFAGVNAHHQTGRVERKIRSLQEQARSMLIFAHHRWPSAITANLWPYAVRAANDALNATPSTRFQYERSPIQVFSGSDIDINHRDWTHVFCPAYVLSEPLQSGSFQNKWRERSTPGMYLGRSPLHARSVALVLNLITGRVSPQFHVVLDPTFSSVNGQDGSSPPPCHWQVASGIKRGLNHSRVVPLLSDQSCDIPVEVRLLTHT